jgi:hypothetical protein
MIRNHLLVDMKKEVREVNAKQAIRDVTCPRCGATPGVRCEFVFGPSGQFGPTACHQSRLIRLRRDW